MRYQTLNEKLSGLTAASQTISSASEQVHALSSALEVVREIIKILSPTANDLKSSEDIIENIIPNTKFANYKIESWFCEHPIYPSDRTALYVYDDNLCEMKFYWLNENSTKARISAGVMMSPNWEDRDSTRNDSYKVGIDFFLKRDCKSLLMVISNHGNLRVMEFSSRLTHTQVEILEKISGALSSDSKQILHTTLWDSMALSEVNKHFYEGIAKNFAVLYQFLVTLGKDKEDAKMFSSRLLGRLLFVWFLRKKNAISRDDYYFPSDIEDSTSYYNTILKSLFFQTFNTPEYARKNGDTTTPYLNGGLFEAHDNDWPMEEVIFPNNFFNDLYSHLNKYNFTTDESSPDYEQVAIDPEMLGRVFESLLAEQFTDTGEQVRKKKGTFYTPREIVSYMCKESLRQYLYSQLGDYKYHDGVDRLLDSPDYEWETAHSNAKRDLWPFENINTIIPRVIGILDSLKVLDPACGSGAFPMGMLQLLTKTYERLDSRFDPYRTKLNIIQNTIYGVDLEPMAIEISRLRAWLAIIVDDKGSIDPLPNLDFKFVCANSLVPLVRSASLWSDPTLQEKLSDVREKFFNARKPEIKEKWKNKYYSLTTPQISFFNDERESQLKSFDPFKNKQPALFFDPEFMFGIEKFDIVIENPPYVKNGRISREEKDMYLSLYQTPYDQWDLYVIFFELSLKLLNDNGTLCVISPNQWLSAKYGEKLRGLLVDKVVSLTDFRQYSDFENASVNTFITICKKESIITPVKILTYDSNGEANIKESERVAFISMKKNLGAALSDELTIIDKIKSSSIKCFGDSYDIGHSFSIPDYYKLSGIMYENEEPGENERKLLNTGTVSILGKNWGAKKFKYDGKFYFNPVVNVESFNVLFPTRRMQLEPKLIMSSMGGLKICLDYKGQYLGTRPTMWLHATTIDQLYIAFAILNSKLINWFYQQQYSVAGMTGFKVRYGNIKETPFPTITDENKQKLVDFVSRIITLLEQDENNSINDELAIIDDIVIESYGFIDNEKKRIIDLINS